jgi:hypothetical protein
VLWRTGFARYGEHHGDSCAQRRGTPADRDGPRAAERGRRVRRLDSLWHRAIRHRAIRHRVLWHGVIGDGVIGDGAIQYHAIRHRPVQYRAGSYRKNYFHKVRYDRKN